MGLEGLVQDWAWEQGLVEGGENLDQDVTLLNQGEALPSYQGEEEPMSLTP